MAVRDGRDRFDIGHIQPGIAHGLAEKELCFGSNGLGEVLRILGIDKMRLDAEPGEDVVELGECAAVEIVGRNDFIPCGAEIDHAVENRAGSGGHGQSSGPAFQLGHALLENIVRGVHESRVDVPKLLQTEKVCGMLGVAEDKRAGAVNGNGSGEGNGIRCGASMEADGFEFHSGWVGVVIIIDWTVEAQAPGECEIAS